MGYSSCLHKPCILSLVCLGFSPIDCDQCEIIEEIYQESIGAEDRDSLQHALDQPTCRPRLLHWTFDLAAPGHHQYGKGKIDFHDLSRALTDAQVELAQREFTPSRPLRSARQLGKLGVD
jgi:hypothetical protein